MVDLPAPYNTEEAKNMIYTFVKSENVLYRGLSIVRRNVGMFLKSPPIKDDEMNSDVTISFEATLSTSKKRNRDNQVGNQSKRQK